MTGGRSSSSLDLKNQDSLEDERSQEESAEPDRCIGFRLHKRSFCSTLPIQPYRPIRDALGEETLHRVIYLYR